MITHNGTERPVPSDTSVQVTYRDGTTETGLASDWDADEQYDSGWLHDGSEFDIVGYEILVDTPVQADKVHVDRMEG